MSAVARARRAGRHLAELGRWAMRRDADERAGREVLDHHAWTPDAMAADLPVGLELSWLGVAGYALSYEGNTILLDPYLTRVPLADVALRRPRRPDRAVLDRHVPRADAVVIGHTHFDHALDAPAIAERDGCAVYGSRSVETLMGLYGLGDRAVVVEPYRTYDVGPFEISFVPSVHSKLALGLWVPYDGPITCEHLDDLSPAAFNCDQVWGVHVAVAGVTFYHQGSADLIDDAVRHRGVDYFLCGIAGRQFADDYVERILRRLEPRVVIPSHYDNFFAPVDDELAFTVNVGVARFADEVAAVSRDFEIRSLPRVDA